MKACTWFAWAPTLDSEILRTSWSDVLRMTPRFFGATKQQDATNRAKEMAIEKFGHFID